MSATISLLDFTLTWDTARLSSGTHSISVTNPFLPPMHPNRDPALSEGVGHSQDLIEFVIHSETNTLKRWKEICYNNFMISPTLSSAHW